MSSIHLFIFLLLTSQQKVSRSSLTRGGSQDDPAQLLRDLQDSLEREADLREQLRNAEEEVNSIVNYVTPFTQLIIKIITVVNTSSC